MFNSLENTEQKLSEDNNNYF